MDMAKATLEERVSAVEADIAELKKSTGGQTSDTPWWEKIYGTFADSEEYEEAMRLGREYRESQRPAEQQPR